jgi:hypothetical protein
MTEQMTPHARTERQIVSVAAAPGWGALFDQPDAPFDEPRLVTLAAWALVEEPDGRRRLVGLVQSPARPDMQPGTFGIADESGGFAGYSHGGLKTKPA